MVLFERNETVRLTQQPFPQLLSGCVEKNLRVQVPYRIPIPRARIRLSQVPRDRREDQQDQVVSTTKCVPLSAIDQRQDDQAVEGLRKVVEGGGGEQPVTRSDTGERAGGGGAARPSARSFRSSDLKLPRLTHHDTVVAAVPRRTYANAHAYHINSISVNSDGETFISSDDLRINLWNLNIQDQSFNIVDIKPANMEELTEVITAAEFHPQSCNWFMYASSKGTIKLADMRESALCDQHAKRSSLPLCEIASLH